MNVYLNGYYQTKFGELWDRDLRSLGVEASMKAIEKSGIDLKDIDAVYVGNMLASRFSGQDHIGALFATELGLNIPSIHVEAACASGGAALKLAWQDILSGSSKNVLVLGVEKMTDVATDQATEGLSGASDEEWEAFYGVTFPSLYAMIAREHIAKYGTTREQLSMVAVKNHLHGSMNEFAQFRNKLDLNSAINAGMIADPLNLMDCSPISDGAAAVVLSSEKKSKVLLKGSFQAQDSLALHDRDEITELKATKLASEKAYKSTDISQKDLGIIELHDCFTIAEICAYEDLGLVEKGKGGQFIESGKTEFNSELPINTSGGLKSCGHPVGATGIKQIVEIAKQFNEEAGDRQIKNDKKFGLAHNVGGSGATAVVSILERL